MPNTCMKYEVAIEIMTQFADQINVPSRYAGEITRRDYGYCMSTSQLLVCICAVVNIEEACKPSVVERAEGPEMSSPCGWTRWGAIRERGAWDHSIFDEHDLDDGIMRLDAIKNKKERHKYKGDKTGRW
jgi:hypothetical protein